MRLILAALSFLLGVFLLSSGITALLPKDLPEWLTALVILFSAGLSLYLTNKLINVRGTDFWRLRITRDSVEDMEQDGLLTSAEYHATRAFQVKEFSNEGSHYFVELRDGSVLYMNGHYLREYEPLEFDDRIAHEREFPCTEFTVRRRTDGTAVDVQCRGRVFEPETVTPPFAEEDILEKTVPKDGDIITSSTYDKLKTERRERRRIG
jgi:hypothetical protein